MNLVQISTRQETRYRFEIVLCPKCNRWLPKFKLLLNFFSMDQVNNNNSNHPSSAKKNLSGWLLGIYSAFRSELLWPHVGH